MRNFGTLNGRVSRGISAQTALRFYPSPLYDQKDTGYVFGTYGNPVPNKNVNQSSLYYAEQYHERDTNKYDVWSSAIDAVGGIGAKITEGAYSLKGAQIGAQAAAYTPPPESGSSTGLIVALGVGALVIGGIVFAVTR
jgi:hypothetical protein